MMGNTNANGPHCARHQLDRIRRRPRLDSIVLSAPSSLKTHEIDHEGEGPGVIQTRPFQQLEMREPGKKVDRKTDKANRTTPRLTARSFNTLQMTPCIPLPKKRLHKSLSKPQINFLYYSMSTSTFRAAMYTKSFLREKCTKFTNEQGRLPTATSHRTKVIHLE